MPICCFLACCLSLHTMRTAVPRGESRVPSLGRTTTSVQSTRCPPRHRSRPRARPFHLMRAKWRRTLPDASSCSESHFHQGMWRQFKAEAQAKPRGSHGHPSESQRNSRVTGQQLGAEVQIELSAPPCSPLCSSKGIFVTSPRQGRATLVFVATHPRTCLNPGGGQHFPCEELD